MTDLPERLRRVVVLWASPAPYLDQCLDELRSHGASVEVVYTGAPARSGPDDRRLFWMSGGPRSLPDVTAPSVVLVSGWRTWRYLKAALKARRRGNVTVLCMDTQAVSGPRNRVGSRLVGVVLRRSFDGVFVPGDRQEEAARDLGFAEDRIEQGLYCTGHHPADSTGADRQGFVWVGRLVEDKGVDTFIDAYRRYRAESTHPWPATMVGSGPLAHLVAAAGIEGLTHIGKMEPPELRSAMVDAGCFVSSSRYEPWGMVVVEAAAAALPVVCTDAAGSGDHLVDPGVSGHVIPADDPGELAVAMARVADTPLDQRLEMGRRSAELASRYTTVEWVAHLGALTGRCSRGTQ